jgi:uncharacterized surface protein with fasciclin (FAS1) repeats
MEPKTSGPATEVALKTIVETAKEAGDFRTLMTAIRKAGLYETLEGRGPFTVFAPTDEAFSALPKGALNGLLKAPEKLKSVLLYHVLKGEHPASKVVGMKRAKTLSGDEIRIRKSGAEVMIGESRVAKADISCSNGVIHVIDKVLMPPEK